jgi:dTDP-4-amino-4,6-dideoxygalactose transaminase
VLLPGSQRDLSRPVSQTSELIHPTRYCNLSFGTRHIVSERPSGGTALFLGLASAIVGMSAIESANMQTPPPIPFNKPFIVGKELYYIAQAVSLGNLSGDGHFTQQCCRTLEERFGVGKVFLVPSCTAALEMAAQLFGLQPGDEVILPSFTFVSTASAVVRLGARPVFVDIRPDTLNIDEMLIERAITPRTRAIFPVHYAGVGCAMDRIMGLAEAYRLLVAEDAAQAVNAFYQGRALGSIGQLGCYSFHETKNYICGEGGALCVNDPAYIERAEIIRDKGTNRKQFFRGAVDRYTWVDVGSSYVPSELCSAFLYAQLEKLDQISTRRQRIHELYRELLAPLAGAGFLQLPVTPQECAGNYHLFYILLPDQETRQGLMAHLKSQGILAVFHYVPLHTSPMGQQFGYQEGDLPVTENLSGRLLRLPVYYEITPGEQERVVEAIAAYFQNQVGGSDGTEIPQRHGRHTGL